MLSYAIYEWFPGGIPLNSEGVQNFCTPYEFFNGKFSEMENPGKNREKTGKIYRADKP